MILGTNTVDVIGGQIDKQVASPLFSHMWYHFYRLFVEKILPHDHLRSLAPYTTYCDRVRLGGWCPLLSKFDGSYNNVCGFPEWVMVETNKCARHQKS